MNRTIIAIIAVIIVASVVIVSFIFLGSNGQQNSGTATGVWHNGDYVEWTWSLADENGSGADPYAIERYTVTDVGSAWVTVNHTHMDAARDYLQSSVFHIAVNSTLTALNAWEGVSAPAGYTSTYMGSEMMPMMSVSMNMQHYIWSSNQGGTPYSVDVWMVNGIIVRSMMPGDGMSIIIALTGTNMNLTTSP